MIPKEVSEQYVKWFSELGMDSVNLAGGKGANLGEMSSIKMPVPPGFVVLSTAYEDFISDTGLKDRILSALSRVDVEETKELEEEAKKVRQMIIDTEMPGDLKKEILESYEHLDVHKSVKSDTSKDALAILKRADPVFVAVRSSATAEDSSAASFAGQGVTYLNVKGNDDVIEAVKRCWASLFTARSLFYQAKKGFKQGDIAMAVIIQKMVDSDKSGVIFSKDPVGSTDNVIIEAVYGLGEGIVSGQINPDHYEVSREYQILEKKVGSKKTAIVRSSSGKNEIVKLTPERSKGMVLSDYEIKRFAQYALELEEHYNKPQDIEFAVEAGELYIVQTRPITTLDKKIEKEEFEGDVLISGMPASPGIGSGVVRVIKDLSELDKVQKGDVLVTEMTNPDMVVTMAKSSAIVTDEGGATSHAAIVSREMGIPAIVGTGNATEVLKDGVEVTVNGSTGEVYEGKTETKKIEILPVVETDTEIKVLVDLPNFAERAAKTKVKKVGLTRMEGIIAANGIHPRGYLKDGKVKEYEDLIYNGVSKIMEHFEEGWIRTSDIRSDEYKNLKGASKDVEINPMLGMHGIRASLKTPELFKAELNALRRVAENGKTIGVLLPQVISVDDVVQTKKHLQEIGFADAKIGVMVETPAASQIINDLCNEGIDFISFGTNDLTQYTLAVDRGNEKVQYLYDEMHPAVLNQIAFVIRRCMKYGVETSICGQAGSKKGMVEYLVKQGIDSISVNADVAYDISEFVQDLESEGVRGSENVIFKDKTNKEEKLENKEPKISDYKEEITKEINETPSIDFKGYEVHNSPEEKKSGEELKKLEEEINTALKMASEKNNDKIQHKKDDMSEQVQQMEPQIEGEKVESFDPKKLIEQEKNLVNEMEKNFKLEIEDSAKDEGQIDPIAEETADEVAEEMEFGGGEENSEEDINKLLEGLEVASKKNVPGKKFHEQDHHSGGQNNQGAGGGKVDFF